MRPSLPTFPGFRCLRLLGQGGMGAVHLAQREKDGLMVAIKTALVAGEGRARLKREGELLAQLRSDYLPRCYGMFETAEGALAVVMQFVEGAPLDELLEDLEGPADGMALLRRVLPDLARGLNDLHAAGIIHRDLKPANCLIGPARALLVDLGLARGEGNVTLTRTGVALGTPLFLPPEQLRGERAGPKADVYQLARIIEVVLFGLPQPPPDMPGIAFLHQRAVAPPPEYHRRYPWFPPELGAWIDGALASQPERRPEARPHLAELAAMGPLLERRAAAAPASAPDLDASWMRSKTEAVPVPSTVPGAIGSRTSEKADDRKLRPKPPTQAVTRPERFTESGDAPSEPGARSIAGVPRAFVLSSLLVAGLTVGWLVTSRAVTKVADAPRVELEYHDKVIRVTAGSDLVRGAALSPGQIGFQRDSLGHLSAAPPTADGPISIGLPGGRVDLPPFVTRFRILGAGESMFAEAGFTQRPPLGTSLVVGGVAVAERIEGPETRAYPLSGVELSEGTWRLRLPSDAVRVSQVIDVAAAIGDQLETVELPPGTPYKPDGSVDLDHHGKLYRAFWKIAGPMSCEALPPELGSAWLDRLWPTVQAEWRLREHDALHRWKANQALGRRLRIRSRGTITDFPDRKIQQALVEIAKTLSNEAEVPGWTGESSRVTEQRVEFKLDTSGANRSEVTIACEGGDRRDWLEVLLAGNRLRLPLSHEPGYEMTHVFPASWLRRRKDDTVEMTVKLVSARPAKTKLRWARLRVLAGN